MCVWHKSIENKGTAPFSYKVILIVSSTIKCKRIHMENALHN